MSCRRYDQRGDVNIILMVLLMVMLLAVAGLGTDFYRVLGVERTLEAAADAAAAAGANGVNQAALRANPGNPILDSAAATNLAINELSTQSGLPAGWTSSVTVTSHQITVVINATVSTTLLRLSRINSVALTATGTSGPRAGPDRT